jgi:dTDP-4-dehydrorhamnose reductase
MRIAITGKSGNLTQELQRIHPEIIVLDSYNYNINNPNTTSRLMAYNLDVVIHAGAVTDSNLVESNPTQAINTNIIGTANLSNYCIQQNKRLVYISTDYVYPGETGDYKETDNISPYNQYAWTKLGGECSVCLVPDHLIIRTSFGASKFPHEQAWINQLVSKDYVDIIAPKILQAAKSSVVGILNIGTEPKSLFDYAQRRNNVKPGKKLHDKNFTLNTSKYEQLFSNKGVSYNRP